MKRLIALGIFGVFLFFSLTILAQVPQLLNYQGRLTDDKGIPIITPTTVRFSLYQGGDAATPGSGTLVYQEDASVTPDGNGVFSHLIGSGTVVHGTLDSTVFYIKIPVYLEITVDPAGANETLLPRKQIVTVGYSFVSELAYDADKVDGEHAAAFSPVVHNHDPDYVNEGQADSVTSSMILDGTIVDADIASGANIAASKINRTGLDADLLDGKDSLDFVHTTGDDMTGNLIVETSTIFSLYGRSSSTNGRGVTGFASSTSGTNYGVYGESASINGRGVYGDATATSGVTYGVYGQSGSTSGIGVYAIATASSGGTYGVWARNDSPDGKAIYGRAAKSTGTNYGVFGETYSSDGYGVYGTAPVYGVYGEASATSGTTYGVYGRSNSDDTGASGVFGEATATSGTNYGVYGKSDSPEGLAVRGYATASSGENYGVYGRSISPSGRGVYGIAAATSGTNYGVYGITNSDSGYGVYGNAQAYTGTNYGIYGTTNSSSGYAGYFVGKAHVTGTFTAGTKNCVQPIDNGKKVLLYAMESPEIWFEDFGTAQLVNGQAVVQLESVFTQAANTEAGYMVFLTPIGEWKGLYISQKDKDSFEVRELGDGTSNISFDYRIVAKRRGYEEVRFEEFTDPEQPPEEPNLPAETKETKLNQPQRPLP